MLIGKMKIREMSKEERREHIIKKFIENIREV